MYKFRKFYLMVAVPLIWLVGYGFLQLLAYILPLSENNNITLFTYSVIVIGFGIVIPYLMLKVAFHKAHLRNRREDELRLADLPKDQEQLKSK